jgi:hypothetical protein
MKHSPHQHAQGAIRQGARVAEARLQAVVRSQYLAAPDLYSDRDDNAAEYAAILRDFERVHDESADADRFN